MTRFLSLILLFSMTLVGCGDGSKENDDKVETKDISHNGSIETQLTTEHLADNRDVLVTTHKIWKDGVVASEVRHADTIPALGVAAVEAADSTGNAKTVTGKKDYEFYITVK
jgi:hypothetical protein